MRLSRITISGIDHRSSYKDIFNLMQLSKKVELGVHLYPSEMEYGTKGYDWFSSLLNVSSKLDKPLNISAHLYVDWTYKFLDGLIIEELADWFYIIHNKSGEPVIKRWQLNFEGNPKDFVFYKMLNLISRYPDREFTISYDDRFKKQLSKLVKNTSRFSLIYNIKKQNVIPPVFDNIQQGYSGELNTDNIKKNLDKITAITPKFYEFWIEMNKEFIDKYKKTEFDFDNAQKFIINALKWSKINSKR